MKNVLLSKLTQLALVSSLLFFTCSTKASAEVNMKLLNSVIKSCQDNPPKNHSLLFKFYPNTPQDCVYNRYYYTLFMSKYNGLKNLGDLRNGFPSSLALYSLNKMRLSSERFLDCMVSQDSNSSECKQLSGGLRVSEDSYNPSVSASVGVCSSCFEAYINAGSNWGNSMFKDIINWFYELDKPSRKLVVDSLSNPDFMNESENEAGEARQLYLKIKDKVERDTQQQKYRDLLQ